MSIADVKPLPNYEVVPLRSDNITIAAVQIAVRPVETKNPKPQMIKNAEHMCSLVDAAQGGYGGSIDLLMFHFLPISIGFGWDRNDHLRCALDIPGEETEIIGKKAKQYNCYIAFGTYAKHKDWPGHFATTMVVLGPSGDVVAAKWKLRNYKSLGGGGWLATTVYDVLDEYVERYGWDAVWPIARLDIGNLAMTPMGGEPEIARALAMNGAEIIGLDSAVTGEGCDRRVTLQAHCINNQIYGVYLGRAITVGTEGMEDSLNGFTAIVGPTGKILAEVSSHHETVAVTTIPLAWYRKSHSIPVFAKELFVGALDRYASKFPPNTYSKFLPNTAAEAGRQLREEVRW